MEHSAGWDLYATADVWIKANQQGKVGIGWAMEAPLGSYRRLAPRSGLFVNHNITTGAGVIDPDYRGRIFIPFRFWSHW